MDVVEFALTHNDATSVAVLGSWDGWMASTAMARDGGDGGDGGQRWVTRLRLPRGVYMFKYLVDDRDWVLDATRPNVRAGDKVNSVVCCGDVLLPTSVRVERGIAKDASSVMLIGDYEPDGWTSPLPMLRDGNAFYLDMRLPPGRYQYKLLVNGSDYVANPDAPVVRDGDGNENNELVVMTGRQVMQHLPPREPGPHRVPISHFLLHLPHGFFNQQPRQRFPVIVSLGGAGERGDSWRELVKAGLPKKLARADDAPLPFVVIAPQLPQNSSWDRCHDDVIRILDDVLATYSAQTDKTRVYLTGLSMGGHGTWSLAEQYPHRFAAIAPICGYLDEVPDVGLQRMPQWVFANEHDGIVECVHTAAAVLAHHKPRELRFTVYFETNARAYVHDAWTETYDDPDFYNWLLAHTLEPEEAARRRLAEDNNPLHRLPHLSGAQWSKYIAAVKRQDRNLPSFWRTTAIDVNTERQMVTLFFVNAL